ncbi:MAG: Imm21 family immunity protein [Janthinobacterium lividum]
MNEGLEFVCAESAGVPILLCPAEFAGYWEGINEPRNGRIIDAEFDLNGPDGVHVDYDRACDAADDYINIIQIGSGQALVFGEEIPSMYWVASDHFVGGHFVTWVYLAEGELPDFRALMATLPNDFFKKTAYTITCSAQGLLLFPSTNAPMDGEYFEFVEIKLPAGEYAAALGFYETPDTSIRIIKIQQ